MARTHRGSLRKAEEAVTDEKIKQLQSSQIKDVNEDGDPEGCDDDDDMEDKKHSVSVITKSENDDEDDDDDNKEDDDEDETSKSSSRVEKSLQRAVRHLATIIKSGDSSLRKEALFAKSMKGGHLSAGEADELHALVQGQSLREPLRHRAAPAITKSLRKAVSENEAMTDLVKGVAGTHTILCDEIESMRSSLDEVHVGMAKAMSAISEGLGALHQGQGAVAEALDKSLSQPAHAPRSHGVSYVPRGLGGAQLAADYHQQEGALKSMVASAPDIGTRSMMQKALFQLQATKQVSEPVQNMIKSHLSGR